MNKTMKVEGPLHVVCQCDKCKAQPEQGPVAWWNDTGTHIDLNVSGRGTPLYTHPLQRTWVGNGFYGAIAGNGGQHLPGGVGQIGLVKHIIDRSVKCREGYDTIIATDRGCG